MMLLDVKLDELPDQFELANTNKILLLDGDFNIYKVAATVKKLDTAIRRFYTMVLTEMFLAGVKECNVYITPTGGAKCDRVHYPTVKVYQSNRKKKAPLPLREPLKQHLIDHPYEYASSGIRICFSNYFEADDLIVMDSYSLGNGIVSSLDKDLRLSPYSRWNDTAGSIDDKLQDPFGYIYYDSTEAMPLKGHGTKFFWAQMLMGDGADAVKGILTYCDELCGPKRAWDVLGSIETEQEAAETVVKAYASINQNYLAEAECLWLRRSEDDSAYQYIRPLLVSKPLIDWTDALHEYNTQYVSYSKGQLNGNND